MKKFMKKSLAVLLAIVMISATFVSFAAELNQDAVEAHNGQYKNYLLLLCKRESEELLSSRSRSLCTSSDVRFIPSHSLPLSSFA